MKRHLKTFVVSAALFSFALATGTALAVTLPQGPALFETSLQSRISSTDTSMTLVANSVRGGGTLSGYNCFTLDEGRTDAEYICGQVSGTTISSLERAVSPSNGTSTVTAIAYQHRVGADVKITDYPLIQRLRNLLNAVEQFPSLLSYVTGQGCVGTEPNGTICDKGYIDSRVVAGAANANETTKGIVEAGTQIEMASSSALGSTLASLFVQTKYATSSPYGAGLWAVITQNDGKISPNFIATSSVYNYAWAGQSSFASTSFIGATTTLSATTSIAANASNKLVLNTVPYVFPSTQGAAGTTLINNGAGVFTPGQPIPPRYTFASTTSSTVGQNGTVTSIPFSIPADTLSASSTISVTGHFHCTDAGSGGACDVKLIDTNGNTYMDAAIGPGTSKSCSMPFTMDIVALNSTSSQFTMFNGGCLLGSTFTDQSLKQTSSANWSIATSFELQFIVNNASGANGSTDGFIITVTP